MKITIISAVLAFMALATTSTSLRAGETLVPEVEEFSIVTTAKETTTAKPIVKPIKKTIASTKAVTATTKKAAIKTTSPTTKVSTTANKKYGYSEDDLFCMAVVIFQEAGGSSNEIKMMVGNVVLNRVAWGGYYPNTIRKVVTQSSQYGRLHWTGVQFPSRASNPGEKSAVKDSYAVAKRLLEGERVLPKNVIFQAEFAQGSGIYKHVSGFYFCYA